MKAARSKKVGSKMVKPRIQARAKKERKAHRLGKT
jgi:hypothetical protein